MNFGFKTGVELGDRVIDILTEFTGIVTGKADYLNGETRFLVEAIDTTGRPIEWWCEKSRLKLKDLD